jgi:ABC-type sugar transport system ATPase subunit
MQNIIIGIFGYKGSGKTLMMIILLYLEKRNKKRILVNMKHLSFDTEIIKPQDLISLSEKLHGCTIGIDELHTVADSRKSHGRQNINIANFFLQSRHRGVNVIYTDQYQNQAEKRIRENTDIKIIAKNCYIDSDGDGIPDIFEYIIIDVRTEQVKTIRIYGKPFFKLYDDGEIIDIYEEEKKKSKK